MKIYPELKKIANKLHQIRGLVDNLENSGFDADGIDFETAQLVSGLTVKNGKLYEDGECIATDEGDYFCNQSNPYDDCYYGYLYFKTDVPGQYVRLYFSM